MQNFRSPSVYRKRVIRKTAGTIGDAVNNVGSKIQRGIDEVGAQTLALDTINRKAIGRRAAAMLDFTQKAYNDAKTPEKKAQFFTLGKYLANGLRNEYELEHGKASGLTSFASQLHARMPSYAAYGAGGALLGRWIAGKNHKLLGYTTGTLAGLGLNWLRRKSYYGDAITW